MGRPREFDIEKALDTAGELFWRKGYEGTSLSDLTGAIGITPPSFYFAFKSKEALFKQVVDRYQSGHLGFLAEALDQTTPSAVAERVLYGLADAYTTKPHPPGCLALNCSLPCADDGADTIRHELAERRKATRIELRKRFKRFKSSGALPADADPDALARYVLTVAWGMAVEAQSGANRDDLHRTVKLMKRQGSRLGGETGTRLLRDLGKPAFVLTQDVVTALIREGVVDSPPTNRTQMNAIQSAMNAWQAESGCDLTTISHYLAWSVGRVAALPAGLTQHMKRRNAP